MSNKILVGSTYFFSGYYDDFESKDKDYAIIVKKGNGYRYWKELHSNDTCIFEIVKMSPKEMIERIIKVGEPLMIGKFLVPEFNSEYGFKFEDLYRLNILVNKLDDKHEYEKVIYNAYLKNKSFRLTKTQRNAAYKAYKKARE